MVGQNVINQFRISENFMLDEFQCTCCQRVMLHNKFLYKLQDLRTKIEKPIIITSGYRCSSYNEVVGGVKGSYHLYGMAADVYVPGLPLEELLRAAEQVGFPGIGFYPNNHFLHLDVRPVSPARWQG
ncbi:MAG: DUF882 domain-containing protein [Candidatus Atribacteria bacterium]|nr:DUF882 domain-containing protein [Candidatus Atribacteria bacterium]